MVQLQQTRPEFEGQITLVVFPFTKMSHKAPDATAQEIGERLQEKMPEVISAFRQEAYKLSGREINVVMHDGAYDQDAQTVTKDVHDLDRFKEVHFTGGNNNG